VLLETGPTLSRIFLQDNHVDELCLTIVNGDLGIAEQVTQSLGSSLVLVASNKVDDTLFTIWRRGNEIA
jgi:riboflavin biosynthesis pyrimidine reductase